MSSAPCRSGKRARPRRQAVYGVLKEAEHRSTFYIPYWNLPFAAALVPRQRRFRADLAVINACLDGLIATAKSTRQATDAEALQARDYSKARGGGAPAGMLILTSPPGERALAGRSGAFLQRRPISRSRSLPQSMRHRRSSQGSKRRHRRQQHTVARLRRRRLARVALRVRSRMSAWRGPSARADRTGAARAPAQVRDPSLLRFLVDMRDADLDDRQLRDDLMTMLIAGHETTAAVPPSEAAGLLICIVTLLTQ